MTVNQTHYKLITLIFCVVDFRSYWYLISNSIFISYISNKEFANLSTNFILLFFDKFLFWVNELILDQLT